MSRMDLRILVLKINQHCSLQQYAEIRRNTQKYAEMPKQRLQAKTPSKDTQADLRNDGKVLTHVV